MLKSKELEILLRVTTAHYHIQLGLNSNTAYGPLAKLWKYGNVADEEPLFRVKYLSGNSKHSGDSTSHCDHVTEIARYIENFPEGPVKQVLLWEVRDGYDFCAVSSSNGLKKFPPNKRGFVLIRDDSSEEPNTALYYVNTHDEPRTQIPVNLQGSKTIGEMETALFGAQKIEKMQDLGKGKLLHLSARQLKIITECVNLGPLTEELAGHPLWTAQYGLYSLSLYQIFQGFQDRIRGPVGIKNLVYKPDEDIGVVAPTITAAAVGFFASPIGAAATGGVTFVATSTVALYNGHRARTAYNHVRPIHHASNKLHNKKTTAVAIADDPAKLSPHQRWLFESRHDLGRKLTQLMYAIYNNNNLLHSYHYSAYKNLLQEIFNIAITFSKDDAQSIFMLDVSTDMTLIAAITKAIIHSPLNNIQLLSHKPDIFDENVGYIYPENKQWKYMDKPMSQCNFCRKTESDTAVPEDFSGLFTKKIWGNNYQLFYINKKRSPEPIELPILKEKQQEFNSWALTTQTYSSKKLTDEEFSAILSQVDYYNPETLVSQLIQPKILTLSNELSNELYSKIPALSSSSSDNDVIPSKKLDDIDLTTDLTTVYKQVSKDACLNYQLVRYIDSLQDPSIQLAYWLTCIKVNPHNKYIERLNLVFQQCERQNINISDIVFKLLNQVKAAATLTLREANEWMNPLPPLIKCTILEHLLTAPSENVVSWLNTRSSSSAKYKIADWIYFVNNNSETPVNISQEITKIRNKTIFSSPWQTSIPLNGKGKIPRHEETQGLLERYNDAMEL